MRDAKGFLRIGKFDSSGRSHFILSEIYPRTSDDEILRKDYISSRTEFYYFDISTDRYKHEPDSSLLCPSISQTAHLAIQPIKMGEFNVLPQSIGKSASGEPNQSAPAIRHGIIVKAEMDEGLLLPNTIYKPSPKISLHISKRGQLIILQKY